MSLISEGDLHCNISVFFLLWIESHVREHYEGSDVGRFKTKGCYLVQSCCNNIETYRSFKKLFCPQYC